MKPRAHLLVLAVILISPSPTTATPIETPSQRTLLDKIKAVVVSDPNRIRFKDAFPTPLYNKSYFGVAVTGATIVGAAAFTHLTAGAGAPAAATGVSWVASTIAGGGAGSYMAGLSTVGGWFGGNAMLGSALLNGISLGLGGASGSLASLSLMGKIGVATSLSATALDGIAIFQNAETAELEYNVQLQLPRELETKRTQWLINEAAVLQERQSALTEDTEASVKNLVDVDLQQLHRIVRSDGMRLLQNSDNVHDLVVVAVLARNYGSLDLFDQLIAKAAIQARPRSSYIMYLNAIRELQNGRYNVATQLLEEALTIEPYTMEPAILLVNILAVENRERNQIRIWNIADFASKKFDSDKYQTPYSPASIYYRIGSLYLVVQNYVQAAEAFESAYEEFGFLERMAFSSPNVGIVQIGRANALYGMGKISEADALVEKAVAKAKKKEAKRLRAAYAGSAGDSSSPSETLP